MCSSYEHDLPGWPGACCATAPPRPVWWLGAPAMVTCCSVGPPVIMACPGCPGATGAGGLHLDRPFPKPTAATRALVSAGLNQGLFWRSAVTQFYTIGFESSHFYLRRTKNPLLVLQLGHLYYINKDVVSHSVRQTLKVKIYKTSTNTNRIYRIKEVREIQNILETK